MRSKMIAATIAATAVLGATAVGAQEYTGKRIQVSLSGQNNVEGGDPDGSGTATLRINPGQGQVCYTLRVRNIQSATAAHIHEAQVGQTGPVVVDLQFTGTMGQRCINVSREQAIELIREPENYYLNVHNVEYPAGAVRGQLG